MRESTTWLRRICTISWRRSTSSLRTDIALISKFPASAQNGNRKYLFQVAKKWCRHWLLWGTSIRKNTILSNIKSNWAILPSNNDYNHFKAKTNKIRKRVLTQVKSQSPTRVKRNSNWRLQKRHKHPKLPQRSNVQKLLSNTLKII
jgi:hypothetical protein